jgi:hypothetical protein
MKLFGARNALLSLSHNYYVCEIIHNTHTSNGINTLTHIYNKSINVEQNLNIEICHGIKIA